VAATIIGRRAERAALDRFAASDQPEFIAVYGRRRVGKTFLIREHFRDRFTFAMVGRPNATTAQQLSEFDAAARECGWNTGPATKNWTQAFRALRSLIEADRRTGKKVVFLDELPWLATPRSGFLDALAQFWNSWGAGRQDLLLIVCGSATSWMLTKLVGNTSGLYNRVTGSLHLHPFNLAECEEFLRSRHIILNRYQMVEAAMVFGGIPHYLSLLRPDIGLAGNIDALCFAEGAILADEFDSLYHSLFKQPGRHIAVVRTLGRKAKGLTREELHSNSGLTNGGGLTRVLEELIRSGFIRKYRGFGKRERDSLYQLIDPFTLFHLRYLDGKTYQDPHLWSHFAQMPAHSTWAGYAFEQIALLHSEQIRHALGFSAVLTDFASWTGSSQGRQAQIDLVLDRADHIITLCEMKYSTREFSVSADYAAHLRRKRASFEEATRTRKAVHCALITTYGLTPGPHSPVFQSVVTLDDLFHPLTRIESKAVQANGTA
jgi:hypothetical protein